ncbi:MAG: hypothetical protein LBP95_12930 [Deltaproteobacteria bacterium]|jgi:hypothetical protein|nr:hypothetical protein [Deltaproteobacteria bacterium]
MTASDDRGDLGAGSAGTVLAVCAGREKGRPKRRVGQAQLVRNFGLSGDCDAGPGGGRLTLLSREGRPAPSPGDPGAGCGSLGENLVVGGLDLASLPPGSRLRCGDALLSLLGEAPEGGGLFLAGVVLAGIVTEGDVIRPE